jgi:hypothetical protein
MPPIPVVCTTRPVYYDAPDVSSMGSCRRWRGNLTVREAVEARQTAQRVVVRGPPNMATM